MACEDDCGSLTMSVPTDHSGHINGWRGTQRSDLCPGFHGQRPSGLELRSAFLLLTVLLF